MDTGTEKMLAHVADGIGWMTYNNPARLNAGQPVKPLLRVNVTVVGKAVFGGCVPPKEKSARRRPQVPAR